MDDSVKRASLDFSFLETSQHNEDFENDGECQKSAFPLWNNESSVDSTLPSRKSSKDYSEISQSQGDSRNSSQENDSKLIPEINPLLRLIKAMDIVFFIQNKLGRASAETCNKALDILDLALITYRVMYEKKEVSEIESLCINQQPDKFYDIQKAFFLKILERDYCDQNNRENQKSNNPKSEPLQLRKKPSVLAHPDEFKNPSSFLKVYGDPLCKGRDKRSSKGRSLKSICPKSGMQGNWKCTNCYNVNFPRRFNCLRCGTKRSQNDDEMVKQYAIEVYKELLPIYGNQNSVGARITKLEHDSDVMLIPDGG